MRVEQTKSRQTMVIRIAEGTLDTRFGQYREYLYYNGQKETVALVMGQVRNETGVLCRVHSSCLAGHAFNSVECDCREQMEISQRLIQEAGRGVIIWLEQEGKANGHFALLKSKEFKSHGMPQAQAYEAVGFKSDARDFTPAAEILNDLGVLSISLLTDNAGKAETLRQCGVEVSGIRKVGVE